LAFAVAAHLEPEILLIDEVLAVGDAIFQKKCLGKMNKVANEGRTVLFVSHNMNAIEQLCDSCLILENGKLKKYSNNVRDAINDYLFANEEDINFSEWVNSGKKFNNIWFRPLQFYIGDESGNRLAMPVSNNSDFWVHIKANVEENNAMTVGYAIYSENGELLYWSLQTDEKEENWITLKTGINIFSSKIPQRFLNEGTYRLELMARFHGSNRWISKPGANAPSIFLTIKGGLSDSPYMFERPGLLAPIMNWKVKYDA